MAFADIIVLKTGETIDCTILSETDTTLTYKYMLTPKIPDTKTIQKSEIKELTRFTPAQVQWKEKNLDGILPTADLMSASDYELVIQDTLRTFVAKFPSSPEAEKAKGMIATLSDEKTKVLSGEVKMGGKWLDAATAKRESYNIEAYRLRREMKAKMEDLTNDQILPKEIGALRKFDDLRTNYPASLQYLEAISEAMEILDSYEKRLTAMVLDYPVLKEQRQKSAANDPVAKEAIEQEERNFKAVMDSQLKAKLKWRDVSKFDLNSIKAAQALVAKEKQELRSVNVPALQNEIENLNAAIGYIADGNATEADAIMGRLRPNKNNLINKKVFDVYEKKLKDLQAKIAADMKAAKATARTGTAASGGENSPESANPIADAMAKKKEAAKAKEDAEKKAKAEADATKAAAKPVAEPEEEQTLLEKINAYIPFIGGGLLVILILAMVMGKKKKDDDE